MDIVASILLEVAFVLILGIIFLPQQNPECQPFLRCLSEVHDPMMVNSVKLCIFIPILIAFKGTFSKS